MRFAVPSRLRSTEHPAGHPARPGEEGHGEGQVGRKGSKLYLNVNPNKGSGYWNVKIQKKTANGWKTLKGTYRTQGKAEARTINLPKGTYRAVVQPKYGYTKGSRRRSRSRADPLTPLTRTNGPGHARRPRGPGPFGCTSEDRHQPGAELTVAGQTPMCG